MFLEDETPFKCCRCKKTVPHSQAWCKFEDMMDIDKKKWWCDACEDEANAKPDNT